MRLAVLFLTCVALLATQLGGWHLHASAAGADLDEPVAHSTHIHQIDPDGHDHSKDVDIAVGDFGLVVSKLLPALLAVALVLLSVFWTPQPVWPPLVRILSLKRRPRWRPPLRAPPQTA